MDLIQNRQPNNISAITPDPTRPPSSSNDATTTTTATAAKKQEALAQYTQYRSASTSYPSFERLRFVRLPDDYWTPTRQTNNNGSNNNSDTNTNPLLQYWPALIYKSYGELVQDLGKATCPRTKGRFTLLHGKYKNKVVARLLRWDDVRNRPNANAGVNKNSSLNNSDSGDSTNKSKALFPEPKVHHVKMYATLDELESPTNSSSPSRRMLPFYESLCLMDECCTALLQQYSPSNKDEGDGKRSSGSNEEEEKQIMYNYVIQFQKAMNMAWNCLAMDLDEDILTAEQEKVGVLLETPGTLVSTAVAAAAVAASLKKSRVDTKNIEEVEKKKDAEKKVQYLEVAVNPNPNKTATNDNIEKTKSKSVPSKDIINQQKVTTSRTESKRGGGGGGGGTKSRPEASQLIPKKFQSASKTTTTSTKHTATMMMTQRQQQQQQSPLPWKQVWKIMKSKGWTWKGPVGLMTGYRYIKPGCKIKSGQEDIDYFNSEDAVQQFARNVYGWGIRHDTIEELEQVIDECVKYAGEVVPPLHPSTTIGPNEPWRDVWDKMRQSGGWTWKAGSGLMMDYYYIKPNCSIKGGVKGQDYFERVEDVQKFAKRNYGWVGDEGGVGDGSDVERRALMGLNENKLPEKRRRKEKVSLDKPVAKKVKTLKSKVKTIMEEEVLKEEGEEEFEEEIMASREETDVMVDDDSMSRFSEARSTYSQTGFQSKKLFINECADENVPSLEGEQIHPDDEWSDVWKTMRKTGWNWKIGSGLMTDYYYIKPGCNVKDGVEGKDYFVSEVDVKRFAERNYGWNRSVSAEDLEFRGRGMKQSFSTSSEESHFSEAKASAVTKMKSKKTIKKTRNSPQKEQTEEDVSSAPLRPDPYKWKTLWPALQKDGWRIVKAGKYNRLHDWYYIRPGRDPGDGDSELHIDYFLSEEDVCRFAKENSYFDEYEESEAAYEENVEPAQHQQTKQPPKRAKSSSKHPSTPEGCKTQPQDPAKPLPSSAQSYSSQSSSSSSDVYYDWNNLWPVLQTSGWRVVKAFNPLHDWYYVRPNRDPRDSKTKLGRHYFTCSDDVIYFVKSLDEKDGTGKPSRKSDIGGMLKAFEEEATDYSGSQL